MTGLTIVLALYAFIMLSLGLTLWVIWLYRQLAMIRRQTQIRIEVSANSMARLHAELRQCDDHNHRAQIAKLDGLFPGGWR